MARENSSRDSMTPADIRRTREKRGTGTGADYCPWIYTHELSSRGRKHLLPGYMTGRNHHLLSDGEAACMGVLEWHPDVTDIREQFPLLPLESTVALAERLGIRHPIDQRNKATPFVLTVDFVITPPGDGRAPLRVVSFKRSSDLKNRATLVRQELERRYLDEYGLEDREVVWSLVTEHELPHILVKNIAHLSPRTFQRIGQSQVTCIKEALEQRWHPKTPLTALGERVERDLGLEAGFALSVIRQLIYHGLWRCDLRGSLFKINRPLDDLIVDHQLQWPAWSVLP